MILQEFIKQVNNTDFELKQQYTVHQLVEEQVGKTAVICNNKSLIYKELNERSTCLCHKLLFYNQKHEEVIGIMLPRSIDMIVAILGILKTGSAYLPIDPEFPVDRIHYMLKDSSVKYIITGENTNFPFNNIEKINISNNSNFPACKIEKETSWNDLAYVIYTSGSTGNPKGVMITHKAVHNFIAGMKNIIDLNKEKKTAHADEIGEIESALGTHPDIKSCVIICNKDKHKNNYLHAYFTALKAINSSDFRNFLTKKIPYYMIPSLADLKYNFDDNGISIVFSEDILKIKVLNYFNIYVFFSITSSRIEFFLILNIFSGINYIYLQIIFLIYWQ